MVRVNIYVLFLAVVVLIPLTTADKHVFKSPEKCGKGWAFNSPRSRATVKSKTECDDMCSKMNNCKSYQIKQSPITKCQLLKRTAGKWAKRMSPKAGWAYREKIDSTTDSCVKFPYNTCSPIIKNFWNYTQYNLRGGSRAVHMRDTVLDDNKRYYIPGYGNERWLYEYGDYSAFLNDHQTRYYLPFGCHGAQSVIRNRTLWCKEYNNRNIVVYNLDSSTILGKINFDSVLDEDGTNFYAGYSDQCQYDGGCQSDMDVMSDYGGAVTILWGRHNYNCWLAASEIDPDTLEIMETHWLDFKKNELGQGFMTCGRMYFTDQYNQETGNFQLIWDLRSMNYTHLYQHQHKSAGYMRFPNRHGYNAMSDFNPVHEAVDKWNNARFVSMNVEFEPQPADLWQGDFPPYHYSSGMKTRP